MNCLFVLNLADHQRLDERIGFCGDAKIQVFVQSLVSYAYPICGTTEPFTAVEPIFFPTTMIRISLYDNNDSLRQTMMLLLDTSNDLLPVGLTTILCV